MNPRGAVIRRRLWPTVFGILVGVASTSAGWASPELTCTSGEIGVCEAVLELRGGGRMPYYRSSTLEGPNAGVRRAVVVVHGLHRNASGYFRYIVEAVEGSGKQRETIVIAPYFKTVAQAPAGQLAWGEGWKEGGLSTDRGPLAPPRSSFEVIDLFVLALSSKVAFPDLQTIVLTGNSAGGQFVQRYAATNRVESQLAGLQVRYVLSNPGSYMYLNDRRWINGGFRRPDYFARHVACRGWNRYKYGLGHRSGYVGLVSEADVRSQYPMRNVTYLVGGLDTGNENLDEDCEAGYQGRNRLRRTTLFFDFMSSFFPGHRHKLRIVPEVAHDARAIYTSGTGREVLFPVLPYELPPTASSREGNRRIPTRL